MLQLTQNLMTSLFLTDKLNVLTELYLYNYVRLADKKVMIESTYTCMVLYSMLLQGEVSSTHNHLDIVNDLITKNIFW